MLGPPYSWVIHLLLGFMNMDAAMHGEKTFARGVWKYEGLLLKLLH